MLRITPHYGIAPAAMLAATVAVFAAPPAFAIDKQAASKVAEAYDAASPPRVTTFGAFGAAAPRPHLEVQFDDGSSRPLVTVTTPTDPASGVSVGIGDGREAIRLFPDQAAASGARSEPRAGVSMYAGAGGVSTVVEPSIEGARISTVALHDGGADQERFRYRLQLPRGHALRPTADGGVDVVGPGARVNARIAAPWAKDADGVSLPTAYSIHGNTLIQSVDTTAATYPVVADPEIEILYVRVLGVNTVPRGIKIWFSRAETETFYGLLPAVAVPIGVLTRVCTEIKKLPAVAQAIGRYVDLIVDVACVALNASLAADLGINVTQAHNAKNCLTFEASIALSQSLFDFNNGGGRFCRP